MINFKKATLGALVITVGISTTAAAQSYTVKPGDSFWKISKKYGVTLESMLEENKANEGTIIYPGQVVGVPEVGKKPSVSRGTVSRGIKTELQKGQVYGEYLDWFNDVNQLVPRGAEFKATDFYTGKSFMVKRTGGSFHGDCEALTLEDTNIMKEIWGGFSWERRPAIIEYNGRRIACSITAMPHAGNDGVKGGVYTKWRSGGYGAGTNFDYVKGNGMDGHFDIHFAGSLRHMDGELDSEHQKMVKIAAGKSK
jgi:hypothetical protein